MNQAWDLFYHVFRRINKQLPTLTTLGLQYVSPKLLAASNLQLAVPGTYFSYDWIEEIDDVTMEMSFMHGDDDQLPVHFGRGNNAGERRGMLNTTLLPMSNTLGAASSSNSTHGKGQGGGGGRVGGGGGVGASGGGKETDCTTNDGGGGGGGPTLQQRFPLAASISLSTGSLPPTMGVSHDEVRIQSFVPSIAVITSKQRPRKILIQGSNGHVRKF